MNQPRPKLDSVDLWTDVASDLWQVEMADGGVCAMGLEELDTAFERGEIGLQTRVQRPSGGDWRTLAEAAGYDADSMRPVASDIELIEIPRPPPLPGRVRVSDELTTEELAVLPRPRKTGARLAAVAAIGLLAGGILAWRYMPAHPIAPVASTTIPAPTPVAAVAAPPPAATPLPAPAPTPSPETSPAPEGNAVGSEVASAVNVKSAIKAPLTKKSLPASTQKKTTLKQRVKLNAKKKHA